MAPHQGSQEGEVESDVGSEGIGHSATVPSRAGALDTVCLVELRGTGDRVDICVPIGRESIQVLIGGGEGENGREEGEGEWREREGGGGGE